MEQPPLVWEPGCTGECLEGRECRHGCSEELRRQRLFAQEWERCQARITHAIGTIIRNKEDVKDLIQETRLRAYSNYEYYHNEDQFLAWLYRIAVNTSLESLRRKRSRPEQASTGDYRYENCPAPDQYDESERGIVLERACATLKNTDYQVFILHTEAGMTYREIAVALSIPVHYVRNALTRTRKHLQEELKDL